MPSQAMVDFKSRLDDVDKLIATYKVVTGYQVGRPPKAKQVAVLQGEAVIRAAVVFLCAAIEGFVEELFEESAVLLSPGLKRSELKKRLFSQTTERLNTPNVDNTNRLYGHLGILWILDKISWQKFTNKAARTWINTLVSKRGDIAHGKKPVVKRETLDRWRKSAEKYAKSIEKQMKMHIEEMTGTVPGW